MDIFFIAPNSCYKAPPSNKLMKKLKINTAFEDVPIVAVNAIN